MSRKWTVTGVLKEIDVVNSKNPVKKKGTQNTKVAYQQSAEKCPHC